MPSALPAPQGKAVAIQQHQDIIAANAAAKAAGVTKHMAPAEASSCWVGGLTGAPRRLLMHLDGLNQPGSTATHLHRSRLTTKCFPRLPKEMQARRLLRDVGGRVAHVHCAAGGRVSYQPYRESSVRLMKVGLGRPFGAF